MADPMAVATAAAAAAAGQQQQAPTELLTEVLEVIARTAAGPGADARLMQHALGGSRAAAAAAGFRGTFAVSAACQNAAFVDPITPPPRLVSRSDAAEPSTPRSALMQTVHPITSCLGEHLPRCLETPQTRHSARALRVSSRNANPRGLRARAPAPPAELPSGPNPSPQPKQKVPTLPHLRPRVRAHTTLEPVGFR